MTITSKKKPVCRVRTKNQRLMVTLTLTADNSTHLHVILTI